MSQKWLQIFVTADKATTAKWKTATKANFHFKRWRQVAPIYIFMPKVRLPVPSNKNRIAWFGSCCKNLACMRCWLLKLHIHAGLPKTLFVLAQSQAILAGKALVLMLVHLFALSTLSYWPLRWSFKVVGQSECDGWAYRQAATKKCCIDTHSEVATYLLKS